MQGAFSKEQLIKFYEIQRRWASKVVLKPLDLKNIKLIAGCDSSFISKDRILSVFVVLDFRTLKVLEVKHNVSRVDFPYIPGLLAFREAPNVIRTFRKLRNIPDVIMVDGHGLSHFRRFGIASHIGVLLNMPTIGVAKKPLAGTFKQPCKERGCYSPIRYKGEVVGHVLRTKDNTSPVFVSPGNLVDFESALKITLYCARKFRLPEPTRLADHYTKVLKKDPRLF